MFAHGALGSSAPRARRLACHGAKNHRKFPSVIGEKRKSVMMFSFCACDCRLSQRAALAGRMKTLKKLKQVNATLDRITAAEMGNAFVTV